MTQYRASPSTGMRGKTPVPGDKSISHRALILGALAVGRTTITGLLESDDVAHTATALQAMGAGIVHESSGLWVVDGLGVGGLGEPNQVLDFGNSGTGARLMMGVAASHPFRTNFTGDKSLVERPMGRVAEPLIRMGASFQFRSGDRMPLTVIGARNPIPIAYTLPVPSAQVKSAVLLAGLGAPGETSVIEPQATRDHTERMLIEFGATVRTQAEGEGNRITVVGLPELAPTEVRVPGDASSAAFLMVAATVVPNSEVRLTGVGMNPLRTGLLDTLIEMGADIQWEEAYEQGGEPVADLIVRSAALRGVSVPGSRAPRMIDEYPILAVAAACADGNTTLAGLAELKVKESDRLAAIAEGLAACGVQAGTTAQSLTIEGCCGPPPGSAQVRSYFDHRIAMAFLVLGLAARAPVRVDDTAAIATSFPGFADLMNSLGGPIEAVR